jgi:hypothetical protein
LIDLTEALLKYKLETDESKSDKWSDVLLDLDEDSDGSSCGDDSEVEDLYDQASSDFEYDNCNPDHQNDHEDPNTMVIRPTPRRPAPLLQTVDVMPKLERMKYCPTLESIEEEDVACMIQETLQAMDAIPVAMEAILAALQAMQALTISIKDDAPSKKDIGSATPMVGSRTDLVDAPLAALVTPVRAT